MRSSVEFYFRIWLHPEDGDCPEIEVFCYELVDMGQGSRPVTEWVLDSLRDFDLRDFFDDLDDEKHYQIVGRGNLSGSFSYDGEYDEDLELLEVQIAEVPESHFDDRNEIILMDHLEHAIIVWRFDDAPEDYKSLSTHGGDEDWLAFVPDSLKDGYIGWMEEGTSFGCCDVYEYPVHGGVIRIGAHS